jgi:hypothetical protein
MYPEVSYPQYSCTLYIPTERHNAIQSIIIHNIFFLHDIRLGSNSQSLPLPSSTLPPGRSISTLPGAALLFYHGSISAFVTLTSSCSSRLEIPACQRWWLTVLHQQRMEHLKVAVVCLYSESSLHCSSAYKSVCAANGMTTMASTTAAVGYVHDRAPRGSQTTRGGGLTVTLCVRQATPSYRGTQRCTRDYQSMDGSLLF